MTAASLEWSPWLPLRGCWRGDLIPAHPGLYRIRRVGFGGLDYVGQTGLTLRQRLAMLKGIFSDVMPYRAPHTAGPALWALLQGGGVAFEVSVAVVAGADAWRKGLEALAIGLYRQEQGRSPTANFGRMPAGYRASSGNDARLVKEQKRFRGGPWEGVDDSHALGIPPVAPLGGDPQSDRWCGHQWSPWHPIREPGLSDPATEGLYRLRAAGASGLLYIGQGRIVNRLATHLKKCSQPGHVQGAVFAACGALERSWVVGPLWLPHQRLELETDLIAAHLLTEGKAPPAQFLGDRRQHVDAASGQTATA